LTTDKYNANLLVCSYFAIEKIMVGKIETDSYSGLYRV